MAINLTEYRIHMEKNRAENQAALYFQADIDVNGSEQYSKAMDAEIERHPINAPRRRGLMGCI